MLALFLSILIVIASIVGFSLTRCYQVKLIWGVNFLWSSLLTINRTRLSGLQIDWSLSEQVLISLLIFIPSIFTFLLIQSSSVRSDSLRSITYGASRSFESGPILKAARILTALAVLIFIVDFILHGIPILNLNLGSSVLNESRLSVRMPILYSLAHYLVLVATIASSILFFSKETTSKLLWVLVFLYVIVNILHFGRGTLIVFFTVIAICYYIFSPKSSVKKVAITIGPILFMFAAFSVLGNLRQNQGAEFGIIEYGNFDESTFELVAWIYGYAVINFDNLILCIRDYDLRGYVGYKTLLNFSPAFIGEILNLEYASTSIDGIQTLPYVGRFNLPTSFGTFGYDYGWLGVYGYSFFILLLIPLLLPSAFRRMTYISSILLVYLSLSYLFLPVTNFIFSSRFMLFLLSLIIIKLLTDKFYRSAIKY